jgi:hypothetical protein
MVLGQVFQKFARESPLTVMSRVMLEVIFPEAYFDTTFPRAVDKLQFRESLFSAIVDLMGLVGQVHSKMPVLRQVPRNGLKQILDTYYKPKKLKPNVVARWVRHTADHLDTVVHKMGGGLPYLPFNGKVKSVVDIDLSGPSLKAARPIGRKNKLYQHSVVVDPDLLLAVDVLQHGKRHTRSQEQHVSTALLDTVQPQDVWLVPPSFCLVDFLTGIEQRQAFFVVRQHKSNPPWTPAGRRKMHGEIEHGKVFQQMVHLVNSHGYRLPARRITIELENRSPDGQLDLHIMTNSPKRLSSVSLADFCYRRWMKEIAFQEMATELSGDSAAAGHHSASYLVYCLGLIAFNILSVSEAALCSVRDGNGRRDDISWHYLADEIISAWRGMMIALPSPNWSYAFANLTSRQLTNTLLTLANNACLTVYHEPAPKQSKPDHAVKGMHYHVFQPSNTQT